MTVERIKRERIKRAARRGRSEPAEVIFNKIPVKISKLQPRPGDIIVIKSEWLLTVDQAMRLKKAFNKSCKLPEGVQTLIISHPASIDIVKPPYATQTKRRKAKNK